MFKHLKRQEGFTLLELLIVIVIIGILAVLIIPNLASGPARARDAQRKSDLRSLKTALETYFNDNNVYPPAGGVSCEPDVAGCLGTVLSGGTTIYMKVVPADPKPATHYVYKPTPASCTTACSSYTLEATLEVPGNATNPYVVSSAN